MGKVGIYVLFTGWFIFKCAGSENVYRTRTNDHGVRSVPVFLSKEVCVMSDLADVTDGLINYCDNSDGSSVPYSHWCEVTEQSVHYGHSTSQRYWCVGGVWRREFGTTTDLDNGTERHKRFFVFLGWLIFCSGGRCLPKEQAPPPPPPPPTIICPAQGVSYYAIKGHTNVTVTWAPPSTSGDGTHVALSSCCGYQNGKPFPGSVDGKIYDLTFTVTDKRSRKATCTFWFKVFYFACTEPATDNNTRKSKCTHNLIYGSMCSFICNEGYKMPVGVTDSATCEKRDGNSVDWTTIPKCEKRRCPAPTSPVNGRVSCRSPAYEFDTECTFSCIDGYRLNGLPVIYCKSDESWSQNPNAVTCIDDAPPTITCSSHQLYADKGSMNTSVHWDEPLVKDNVDSNLKANKITPINQGDLLSEGMHYIRYIATDSAGNSHPFLSECSVTIQVLVVKCSSGPTDSLSDSRFMRYNCTGPIFSNGVECSLFCDLNLNLNGTSKMACEQNGTSAVGVWTWAGTVEPHCVVVECPPLTPPANGAMVYDTVNARPLYIMLCKSGYDSPVVGSFFTGRLSCQDSGTWYPLQKFPDCIVALWSDMVLPAELIYDGDCNDQATQDAIKENVLVYLGSIKEDIDNSICPGIHCKVDNVKVVCGSNRKRRAEGRARGYNITKRQAMYALVTFDLATQFDLSNTTQGHAYNVLFPLLKKIGDRVATDVVNGKLDIDGFTLEDEAFKTSSTPKLQCPPNLKADGVKCKPCPKGTYMNSTTRNCELCSIGEYNEEDGRSQCDFCPPDHSTLNTGSTHQENCTRLCGPGFMSRTTMAPCIACPRGTYQPNTGASICQRCPGDRTTKTTNTTTANQCILFDIKVSNLNGNKLVGCFSNNISTTVLTVSLWARKESDTGEMIFNLQDNNSDILAVHLGDIVKLESGSLSYLTSYKLTDKGWSHLLVELDFSSNVLKTYVNGIEDAIVEGLNSRSIQSGTLFMTSYRDTGITLSAVMVYPRILTSTEMASFGSMCRLYSTDTLVSMGDLITNHVDGLEIVIPSSCDPFDECATAPCGNNTCVNGIGTFTCVCSGGWTGTRCEVAPDYCLNHDCKRGICIPGSGTYTCNCTDFYTGIDCSFPPDNGGWTVWTDWSSCDVTCDGGAQARQRLCVEPVPGPGGLDCAGAGEEIQQCNIQDCPVCPNLKRGYGTTRNCHVNTESGDQHCNVSCLPGKIFPSGQEPYNEYECGRSTGYTWKPFGQIPDCEDFSAPTMLHMQATATFEDYVPKESRTSVEEAILENFKAAPCVANSTCESNVTVSDTSGSNGRKRRAAQSSIAILFMIPLPDLKELDMAGYTENKSVVDVNEIAVNAIPVTPDLQKLQDAFNSVQDTLLYLRNNSETVFNVKVADVTYTVDSSSIESFIGVHCKPGFSGTEGLCVECSVGTYEVSAMCMGCDVGTYQSSTGQTTCTPCPIGYTTEAYMSTSIEECNVLTTKRPETTTAQQVNNIEHTEDSKTITMVVSVVVSAVAVIGIVVAVLFYKHARKQARIAQKQSWANMNMVSPNEPTSIDNFFIMPMKE